MPYEDEPTEEHRAIGRARPPRPPAEPPGEPVDGQDDAEPGWDDPPTPVDAPVAQRPTTTQVDKQRNQRR
jgi:hypothetical protein